MSDEMVEDRLDCSIQAKEMCKMKPEVLVNNELVCEADQKI